MSSSTPNRGDYAHIPIPTYEEAVSSRPGSSQRNFLGPAEVSHDAERQGLLGIQTEGGGGLVDGSGGSSSRDASRFRGYQAPTVESARSSFDALDGLGSDDDDDGRVTRSARASMEELRREMSEMEFEDNGMARRNKWSARGFASALNLRVNLPNIRLPNRVRAALPSWEAVRSVMPRPPGREVLRGVKFDISIVIRVVALIFILSMAYLVFFSDIFRVRQRAHRYDPEVVRQYMLDKINEGRMRSDLSYISSFDHMAGTEGSYVLGNWVKDEWTKHGIKDVSMERYEVYLNYPKDQGRKVAIVEPADKAWTAVLKETEIYPDVHIKQAPVFHGHSKSGSATGPLIYANYGSKDDFQKLKDMGVKAEGSVVLMRHGGTEPDRAMKIRAAEMNGAVGAILFSDPGDQDKDLPAFDGPWRADDSVQRGSVSNMAKVLGDVLSPGFASTPKEKKRLSVDRATELGYLPKIPSLPISLNDAQKLLQSLEGIGKDLQKDAANFLGKVPYVKWFSGSEASPKVLVENNNDDVVRQPIYNVVGRIEGDEQSAAKVIVGNHRDAWCFGAVDPGSGTVIMMEVARIFTDLIRASWRPARTVEFVSWDAEEYNMIGSTEHVEQHIDELRRSGVAYVNIDAGVFGPDFHARASPLMQKTVYRALERVWDESANATLRQLWTDKGSKIEGLGAGSDYAAFQHLAGVPSLDVGMKGSSFPRHSCHDNFQLMDSQFDKDWKHHRVMAQVFALLILDLVDEPILPFDFEAYSGQVESSVNDLIKYATDAKVTLDFGPLTDAVGLMKQATSTFSNFEDDWRAFVRQAGGFESSMTAAERVNHNNLAARFEKDLLDLSEGGGLPGREQFKHLIFSPSPRQGYETEHFASIREPIDRKEWDGAQAAIRKVAKAIETASRNLVAS